MSNGQPEMAAVDVKAFAESVTSQLIDIGAACQKARSFAVCTEDTPLRSVYVVYAERLESLIRKKFLGES